MTHTVINTVRHPCNASTVLNHMLAVWEKDPRSSIIVVVAGGKAADMGNSIRVKLSNARRALKTTGHDDFIQFGMEFDYMQWTAENGVELQALCVSRIRHKRHTMMSLMAKKDNGL